MAAEFYVRKGGKVHGPFSPAELKRLAKAGKVTKESEVRRGQDGKWYPAAKVSGLFDGSAGSGASTRPQGGGPSSGAKARPKRGASAAPKKGKRPASREAIDDDFDDDLFEDDLEDDLAAEDDFDDYDDYDSFEDYGPPAAAPSRSKKKQSSKAQWKLVAAGMLILAISTCVFAGAAAMSMLGEGLAQIGWLMVSSAIPSENERERIREDAPERPTSFDADAQREYRERLREYQEELRDRGRRRQKRAESGGKMISKGYVNLSKVGTIFGVIAAVGLIVGCAFCIFAPQKNGAKGLAIAAVSVAGVNAVLLLVFEVIPWFQEEQVYDHSPIAVVQGARIVAARVAGSVGGFGFSTFRARVMSGVRAGYDTTDALLSMLFDFVTAATFILLGLTLSAVARAQGQKRHAGDCMMIVWTMAGFAGGLLLFYIFVIVDIDAGWIAYLLWLFHWAANGALGFGLFLLIKNGFYSWSNTG